MTGGPSFRTWIYQRDGGQTVAAELEPATSKHETARKSRGRSGSTLGAGRFGHASLAFLELRCGELFGYAEQLRAQVHGRAIAGSKP